MKKVILKNGLKVIYEYRIGEITSFCIGLNAGALEEKSFPLGTAHAVEHMVYKGTKIRTEQEINRLCDSIFGFQNAMTNFPYVIYYGTCLSEDFTIGLELYSDILQNPTFKEEGFKEEIKIILEELKEWKDDIYQYCEDELFYNAFKKKRIKDLIIGTEETVKSITLNHIRKFYCRYYAPENCTISICSSLDYDEVLNIVKEYFEDWNKEFLPIDKEINEENKSGVFKERLKDINGCKIQYLFNIDSLNEEEFKAILLFNEVFGEGTSSILFDEIRTKAALVYDVKTLLKNERGIKVFSIVLGTSQDNSEKTVDLVNKCIKRAKKLEGYFSEEVINQLSKNIKLKRQLKLERSIQLCKELSTYELMYNSSEKVYDEVDNLDKITEKEILNVINKVLKNPSIQIITK